MKALEKWGGYAAIIEALAYIAGFTMFMTVLDTSAYGSLAERLAYLSGQQGALYMVNFAIYLLFGVMLVVLSLALRSRLRTETPALADISAALGLIWATLVIASGMIANAGFAAVLKAHATDPAAAEILWTSFSTLQDALGGGNELVGGLWVLVISAAGARGGCLPRALNWLGYVVGGAGVLTTVPALGDAAAVFGLGQIAWFLWLGAALLRSTKTA